MNCTIVGLPYYEHKKYREDIKEGTTLYLIHDEGNRHSPDNTAVAAYYKNDKARYPNQFVMIGHVSGTQSAEILKLVKNHQGIIQVDGREINAIQCWVETARPSSLVVSFNKKPIINYDIDPYKEINLSDTPSTAFEYLKNNPTPYKKKESTMLNKLITANKTTATTAAYFEAGRIATNQLVKLISPRAPIMVRGYIDTPMGKLVLANAAAVAAEQFRPMDAQLKKVTAAMLANAYQELIRTVDIEGIIDEFTNSDGLKKAFASVSATETSA